MAQSPLSSYDKALNEITEAGLSVFKPVVQETERRPSTSGNTVPQSLIPLFDEASTKYQVPVNVIMALAQQESSFNPTAMGQQTKWGRAKGLMQYLDSTAEGMGINPYDPAQSIDAAAKQIRQRLDKGYSMEDAVKEHFAGPNRKMWGAKTTQYGIDVMRRAQNFLNGFEGSADKAPSQPQVAETAMDPYPRAKSAMEDMDIQRMRTDAEERQMFAGDLEELNKDQPGRFTIPTDEQLKAYYENLAKNEKQEPLIDVQGDAKKAEELRQSMQQPTGQEQGNKDANLLTDTGNLLWSGVNSAAENLQELIRRVPGVGPAIVDGVNRADKWLSGKTSDEIFKETEKALDKSWSPEMLAARKKEFVTEGKDGYSFGPAWSDPRAYYSGLVESLPETVLTMGAAGRLAKGAYTGMIARGASREEAARRAATVATVAGGLIEGGMGGAASSRQVRDEINGMSQDQLKNSDVIKSLMSDGKSFEEARTALAEDSATKAFFIAGVGTGIFGGMGDRALAKIITTPVMGRVKSAAKGAVAEGLLEEAPQSAVQQMGENYSMQDADPSRPLMKGVANAAAQGAAVGGIMGAGMGAAAPHVSADAPAEQAATENAPAAAPQADVVSQPAPTPVAEAQPAPKASGPLGRALENTATQASESGQEIRATGHWFGEPGTQQTVTSEGIDPFRATVDSYAPNGDVILRDENGDVLQVGPGEIQAAKQAAQEYVAQQQEEQAPAEAPEQVSEASTPEVQQPQQVPEGVDPVTGEILDPVQAAEPVPEPKTYDEMTEGELRDRLKYVATQAKGSGWDKRLTAERRKIEAAIDAKTTNLRNEQPANAEVPAPAQSDISAPAQSDEVGDTAQQPAVASAAEQSGTGGRADDVPVRAATDADPALNKDGSRKWFGTERKAAEYLTKKGIEGTHEVRLDGRRFEIHPKAEATSETAAIEREQTREDVQREMEQDDNADSLQRLNDAVQAGKVSPADAQIITERAMEAARKQRDRSVAGDYIDEAVQRLTGSVLFPENASTIEMAETGQRIRIDKAGTLDFSALGRPQQGAAKPVKGRVPGGPRVNRARKLLGAEVGDTVSPQGDVGYARGGEAYKIDRIEKNGTVHVTNLATGGGTTLSLADMERAHSRSVGFDRRASEAETAERSATSQADSAQELRDRANGKPSAAESVAETETAPEQSQRPDAEWQQFPEDWQSLNIPRAEMPQIKAEHRGALVNFLNARGIEHREGRVPADTLKPTQAEFSPERVERAANREGGDRSILVSSDGYVLDGHHQWLAARNDRQAVKSIILEAPIRELLNVAREFPSSTVDTSSAANDRPAAPEKASVNFSDDIGDFTRGKWDFVSRQTDSDGETTVTLRSGNGRTKKTVSEARLQRWLNKGIIDRVPGENAVGVVDEPANVPVAQNAEPVVARDFAEVQNERANADPKPETMAEHLDALDYSYGKNGGYSQQRKTSDSYRAVAAALDTNDQYAFHKGMESEYFSNRKAALDLARSKLAPKPDVSAVNASEYGADNKLVSQDRAAELRKKLKAKFSQLNSGIDPEILAIGTELAVFHIEASARKFSAFAKAMAADLDMPLSRLRPYLRSWYNGARDMMEDSGISVDGMDSPDAVRSQLASLQDEAQDTISVKFGGNNTATYKLPRPAHEMTREEITTATGQSGALIEREHSALVKQAYADGKNIPDKVLYENISMVRPDLSASQQDQVSDAMVDEYRSTSSYEKAVGVLKNYGKVSAKTTSGSMEDMVSQFDSEVSENVSGARSSVEQNSGNATDEVPGVQETDVTARRQDAAGTGRTGESTQPGRRARDGGEQLSDDGTTPGREPGDQRVHQPDGQFRLEGGVTGSAERGGSRSDRAAGTDVERSRAKSIADNAAKAGADLSQRLAAQRKADKSPTKWGDKASIDAALPLLLPAQRDDVMKVEQQHAKMPGILITNGTGTGKTASGMGVAKRYANAGKDNILITVPTDKIAADWVKFGGMMGLKVKQLDGVDDNGGTGPVITTYANLGQNDALAKRDWDLIIPDESHYLSSNEKGETTGALDKLRALSGHHAGFYDWMKSRYSKEWSAMQDAADRARAGNKDAQAEFDRLSAEWDAMAAPLRKQWEDRWSKQQDMTKVVFLSATPFAYVKNVDYAEGYLFNYTPPADQFSDRQQGGGYNSADGKQMFFMQNFGYRMKYNKLTQPEAGVNSELMEQNFNQQLKDSGALTGRTLDVPFDYDRKFALIDDAAGRKLDAALKYLNEAENGKYRPIYEEVMRTFDYQRRMFLLESMKARAAVPMIKQHLALGRKVVVFHDYNKGGGFSPFAEALTGIKPELRATAQSLFQQPRFKIDFRDLYAAIDTMVMAFPGAMLFNGTVSKAQRRRNADLFNDDNSGRNLIVVQSDAGREGVSLHDTTGKHQRVLINLGMPVKPVAATQIEGRIYRTGQASDAAFRYLTTGTAWEASAFASKIAERASTAENLALGNEARGLKQSFIDAYNDADVMQASKEDGKGGKAYDRSLSAGRSVSPFDRAKTFYYAQQKNTKRRDQREGADYYATPEPVGLKMVEWAGIKPGDKVLEPSAGHGAIARFFPDQTDVTMVEPSYDLSQRAALANGTAKIVNSNFEDFHITNKFDAIVMNPPYGNGGKTAIEHVSKAGRHLREGGRIVALIPRGGMTDRRLAQFMESDEAKGLQLVAKVSMPGVTFERAGTSVNTQVVVLEKHTNAEKDIQPRNLDLSSAENINELFDRIESVGLPPRQDLTVDQAIANATENARYSVSDVRSSVTRGELGSAAQRLIDSGQVQIHETAPEGVPQNTQGWTDEKGIIHLVADKLNPQNATSVLLHEAFHAGARPLVGEARWNNLNARFERYMRVAESRIDMGISPTSDWDKAYSRIMIAEGLGDQMNRHRAREELAAYAVENFERMPPGIRKWVQSVIGAVKEFIARRFGKQIGEVTPAQLRAMAKAALISGKTATRVTAATSIQDGQPTPPANKEVNSWIGQKWDATKALSDQALKTAMPTLLHWTPSRVILTRIGQDIPALKEYADTKMKMDTYRDDWHAKTDKLAQRWTKYRSRNVKENSELMALMHESTLSQVDPSEDFQSSLNNIDRAALRGDPKSDAYQDAAAKVAEDKRRQADHTAMRERFDKLSPEGQALYREVRDIYSSLANAQEQIIVDNLQKAMEYRVKEAERAFEDEMQRIRDEGLKGDEATEAVNDAKKRLENARKRDAWNRKARITKLRQEFESNRLAGPYFPLSRFGDFFVTARDKATGEVVSFSRMESAREQSRIAKELKAKGHDVEEGVVSKSTELRKQVPADFVARIEDILKDMPASKETQDQVWQLYLQTMPDYSLRKNRIHRKGRAGFEEDALRAFASHMFHGAHQTARLKYAMDLGDLIDVARRQTKTTRSPVRSGLVVNQIEKNHQYVMNPTSNKISQIATQGAFMWFLAQSPASALVNMAQTFIIGVPKLAAFHGSNTAKGMAVGLAQTSKALGDITRGGFFAEKSAGLSADERKAIDTAYRIGLITRTQSHDVAGIADSGIKYTAHRAKIMAGLSWMFHHGERVNREATFLAGYRMARNKGYGHDGAIDQASTLTWDTHYDYQNTSRPAVMHSNTGKALLVFRNYTLNMLADLAYNTYSMINPRNPAERKEARTQMLGIGTMLAFNAGIRGLPLYGIAMMIAGMFSDDGEDPEVELKKTLLEYMPPSLVGMMMDGVPGYGLGIELSGRIGFGDLWFRSDDRDREGQEAYNYWLQQVLGASVAIPANWVRGVGQISDGYTWRGIESIVPKAVRDPMRAYRYATEGATTKDGDPIVDDVNGWDVFKQAIGFSPAAINEQYKLNNVNMNKQKAILGQRSRLLADYYKADKAGDEKKLEEIGTKIDEFSDKYPEMQIDNKSIRRSMKNRDRYRDSNTGGMSYNNNLRDRLIEEQPAKIYR